MLEFTPERRIPGGLRLDACKEQSTRVSIATAAIPDQIAVAVTRQAPEDVSLTVEIGQHVLKGQTIAVAPRGSIAADAHASTSGAVRSIEIRPVPTGTGVADAVCVVIDCDGQDEWIDTSGFSWAGDRDRRLDVIRQAGIVGLGGAAFPTAIKLGSAADAAMLIVNGAECEPYISCDDMLMRGSPDDVVAGSLLLCDLIGASECIVAIERDKPEALAAIGMAARRAGDRRIRIAAIPSIYPAGGERQLVEVLTGVQVPSDSYPGAIGYVCQNVGTAHALSRLISTGRPIVSRVVTVTGGGVAYPQNVEVLLGTSIASLIESCGGYTASAARLIIGGSMMGYSVPSDDLPITKATNCVIVATTEEIRTDRSEWPCIRCGDCASACPVSLQPQELLRAARSDDHSLLEDLGLIDCIECGCCDVVCPSHIPLTQTFVTAKRSQRRYRAELEFSKQADARFHGRERRRQESLEQETRERHALVERLRGTSNERTRVVAEAVERAATRRKDEDEGAH
jgi:electron transport complex protein RnfC